MLKNRDHAVLSLAKNDDGSSLELRAATAAIICTEMEFRSLAFRIAEYCVTAFLLLNGRDIGHISLGIAQVSVRHYRDFLGYSNKDAWKASMRFKENWKICALIVASVGSLESADIIKAYNGRSTRYYAQTFARYRKQFEEILRDRDR